MRKILPWIAMVWGSLVIFRGVPKLLSEGLPNSAYEWGQSSSIIVGILLFGAGLASILKKKEEG